MKKHVLFTLAFVLVLSSINAQVYDRPRPANESLHTSSSFDDKAGNLGQFCGYNLAGLASGNNGNDGVMFKVRAKENIYINGFSVAMDGSIGIVRIYKKSGTYTGFTTTPGAWLLVDSAIVTPNSSQIIFAGANPDAFVSAGNEASFYITGTGSVSVDYQDGTTEGAVLSENPDLIIYEGVGVSFPFDQVFSPRDFVGKVHYCKATEFLCDTSGTTYNDDNGNAGVFFNVNSKSKSIQLDNIFADITGSSTDSLFLYTKTGTFEGSETNAAAWTLISTASIANPTDDGPEAVSAGMSLTIPANSTQGFHLVTKNGNLGVDYSNGITLSDTIRNEAFIAITGGVGASFPFDNGFPGRKFHGTVSYCVDNTSIDEVDVLSVNLFPNPTTNFITISTNSQFVENVVVVDVYGKSVLTYNNVQTGNITLDVSTLSTGTYFAKIFSKGNALVKTFIKQ